jgi:hypothetical protein
MSLEAVECARAKPEFLQYLRDLIELEGEAEAEVAIVDATCVPRRTTWWKR